MDRYNRKASNVEYEHEWEVGSGPLVVARVGYERASNPSSEMRDGANDEANSDLGNTGREAVRPRAETH